MFHAATLDNVNFKVIITVFGTTSLVKNESLFCQMKHNRFQNIPGKITICFKLPNSARADQV